MGQSGLVSEIARRFELTADQSVLDLLDAITSLARDTRDSQIHWRLEELGGGVLATLKPPRKTKPPAAQPLVVEACSAPQEGPR
jgi:hypothetical protein